MGDRMTKERLDARCANVNQRMESRGSGIRYDVGHRNGYCALDRVRADTGAVQDLVRTGTKGEIGEFLHAMMVALDDSRA